MRYLIAMFLLSGCCAAEADEPKPAAPKETYTAAVQRFEASVKGLSETVGNATAELEGVKEELKAVRSDVAEIKSLLTLPNEIAVPVPPVEPPPVKVDAPPKDADRVTVTLHGKPLDVASIIHAHYKTRWTHPGSIDSHLTEHGVAGFSGLDNETKEKLHSALHEMGQAPSKAVVKQKAVVRAAPMSLPVSSCPNGQCPNAGMQFSYGRSRLFGRYR